eukprot:c53999_g1_i1 orf=1-399(-)
METISVMQYSVQPSVSTDSFIVETPSLTCMDPSSIRGERNYGWTAQYGNGKLTPLQVKSSPTTGMAFVVPVSWDKQTTRTINDESETVETVERHDERTSFSITCSDFDFSAQYSESESPSLIPTAMSSADELF